MFHEIYSICLYFILDSQEMTVFKTPKQHKKSAPEGGRLVRLFVCLLYNHFLGHQNKMYTLSTSNGNICLEVQLCIQISISKNQSNFDIVTILRNTSLLTSLRVGNKDVSIADIQQVRQSVRSKANAPKSAELRQSSHVKLCLDSQIGFVSPTQI